MGLSKRKSALNWTLQILMGTAITVIGLWMGLTLFLTLNLEVKSNAVSVVTSPWPYPWGRAEFFIWDDERSAWDSTQTDHNGWDGWRFALEDRVSDTRLKAVLYDLLGGAHMVEYPAPPVEPITR